MSADRNPQAVQMGDESMARNLALQALAIWPQEHPLFARYGLGGDLRILDLGCGTGEITRRLALHYPQAHIVGIDILEGNLAIARRDSAAFGGRVADEVGDAFALTLADAHFDLVVCLPMSQAVPNFALVLDEIDRVLKPVIRIKKASRPHPVPAHAGDQARPATTLTLSAMMITLKKNAMMLCASATCRIERSVICTSDTWNVMPMTAAKYAKSQ